MTKDIFERPAIVHNPGERPSIAFHYKLDFSFWYIYMSPQKIQECKEGTDNVLSVEDFILI